MNMYLVPGQAALGYDVCRQDTLSPAWGGPLQQRGGLEEMETTHMLINAGKMNNCYICRETTALLTLVILMPPSFFLVLCVVA